MRSLLNPFLQVNRFLRSKAGNLSIMAAIILPVGLGAAGLALDM